MEYAKKWIQTNKPRPNVSQKKLDFSRFPESVDEDKMLTTQCRERKRKRQEEEAAAAAARVVPQRVASVVPPRVARVASPVEAAGESEEEATLSELEAQLEAPQPAEAQPEDKEETVIMSHKP